jgi:hypothetical protein
VCVSYYVCKNLYKTYIIKYTEINQMSSTDALIGDALSKHGNIGESNMCAAASGLNILKILVNIPTTRTLLKFYHKREIDIEVEKKNVFFQES